jgi:hypothetical protein
VQQLLPCPAALPSFSVCCTSCDITQSSPTKDYYTMPRTTYHHQAPYPTSSRTKLIADVFSLNARGRCTLLIPFRLQFYGACARLSPRPLLRVSIYSSTHRTWQHRLTKTTHQNNRQPQKPPRGGNLSGI